MGMSPIAETTAAPTPAAAMVARTERSTSPVRFGRPAWVCMSIIMPDPLHCSAPARQPDRQVYLAPCGPLAHVSRRYGTADPVMDGGADTRRIIIHAPEDFAGMRSAGRLAAETLDMIIPHVKPGVSTGVLDKLCHDFILDHNAVP